MAFLTPHSAFQDMISNNNCPKPGSGGSPEGLNMGVTWFLSPSTSDLNTLNNNRDTINTCSSNRDSIDLIDIEDEDHSFKAFFIGMETGPSPYVKRPLVQFMTFICGKIWEHDFFYVLNFPFLTFPDFSYVVFFHYFSH